MQKIKNTTQEEIKQRAKEITIGISKKIYIYWKYIVCNNTSMIVITKFMKKNKTSNLNFSD